MKHFKLRYSAAIILAACLILSACADKKPEAVNVQELGTKIASAADFPDTMTPVEPEMMTVLYGLNSGQWEEYFALASGGATADELVVVRLKDEKSAGEVKEQLEKRRKDREESFTSYAPQEAKKAGNGWIKILGSTVIYCVCPNAEAAKKMAG